MHNNIFEIDIERRQLKRLAHVEAQLPETQSFDFNQLFIFVADVFRRAATSVAAQTSQSAVAREPPVPPPQCF